MTPRRIYTRVAIVMTALTIAWLAFLAITVARVLRAYNEMDSYFHNLLPSMVFGIVTSSVAWLVVMVATAVRINSLRERRAGRGLCTCCGYDRLGLPIDAPCPECSPAP